MTQAGRARILLLMPETAVATDLRFGFDPRKLGTLNELVELRAERDAERPFVTFLADGDADERVLSFGRLGERTLAVAGQLARRGLHVGDRVLVMLPSGLLFIETFFGILRAGMVPVPVYPPARLARVEHYLRTLASISDTAGCRGIVVDERLIPLVQAPLTVDGQVLVSSAELEEATEPGTPFDLEPESPAFLQFTSGTTSQPRGVLLLQRHVMAQLESYATALGLRADEPVVSWLPLYHDLGLIGKVLASLYGGNPLILLSPLDFLKDPLCWLRAISRHRAVHVAAPNFAYQLCVRKCPPERLEGIDLSSVENAGMGGEPVSATTVESFRKHFEPYGFDPQALNPCYGLAENTLVATGHRRGEPLSTLRVSLKGLQRNQVCDPEDEADAFTLVGNGRAFPGMKVRIVGEDGVGEIQVQGPSLAAGYFGDDEATSKTFVEEADGRWLRTGDLGFLADGNLYICGRQKDLMIVRGRNYYPQDLEEVIGRVDGVRVGNAVAFSAAKPGEDEVAVVVGELDPRAARPVADVAQEIREAVSSAFGLALHEVVLLPKGSVPKTSSGKLQRSLLKAAYLRGELATFAPPGRLSTNRLKLKVFLGGLRRKLSRRPRGEEVVEVADVALDPRITEAVRAVRADLAVTLAPRMRLEALGLDSLERVELWLAVERMFSAKVPEEAWEASHTLGELQELLRRYEGTGTGERRGLIDDLLETELPASEPFRAPLTEPLVFGFLEACSRVFWRLRVEGREHLPPDGCVVAGNHHTYLDGAWLRNALGRELRRQATAFSYAKLPAFTRVFLRQMHTIPIDPAGSFKAAMLAGLQALRDERALLIFPEGQRSYTGDIRPFRPGAALLSLLSQRPLVPFRVRGGFKIYPRDRALPRFLGGERLEIHFGAPITPPPHVAAETWAQTEALTRQLRSAVEAL